MNRRADRQVTSNFGMQIAQRIAVPWIHGADPVESLRLNKYINQLKQDLQDDPSFLQKKIHHHIIDNPHRVTLIMTPDADYVQKESKEEKEKLEKIQSSLSDEQKKEIISLAKELKARQEQVEGIIACDLFNRD